MKTLVFVIVMLIGLSNISFAREYAAGQVWKYKTRKGEENSLLYIVKIDSDSKLGNIYHIYLDGVKIRNTKMSGGFQSQLPHAPVSQKTLDISVTSLVRQGGKMPDIAEGYKTWHHAFDSGHAGIFTISVAEILGFIETAVNK